jgi:hypothetical protein
MPLMASWSPWAGEVMLGGTSVASPSCWDETYNNVTCDMKVHNCYQSHTRTLQSNVLCVIQILPSNLHLVSPDGPFHNNFILNVLIIYSFHATHLAHSICKLNSYIKFEVPVWMLLNPSNGPALIKLRSSPGRLKFLPQKRA